MRPAFSVVAIVVAICVLQLCALLEPRSSPIGYDADVLRSLATVALTFMIAGNHFNRRRVGARLARSELRYRLLTQETADLILLVGPNAASPYVSPSITALLGYSAEEVCNAPIRSFIHPEDREQAMGRMKRLANDRPRDTLTLRLRHKNGSFIWVEATLCWIEQPGGGETIVTIRDVTERHREAEDLRQATLVAQRAQAEADRANRAKTEFLACMSHEIRTPLNAVLGFAGLLLETPDLSAAARLHGERIQASGNALLTIVNDVLDFSQVEAGVVELQPCPFSLPGLIDECLSIVQQSAVAKHLSLHVNLMDRLPTGVFGDTARLRQILLNLLNNAIKFTHEGSVLLDIRHDRSTGATDRMKFSVIDTGIGIAKEDRPRLFQRFVQVDASIRRNYGGTGLGLAICKRLVELMDGQIGVESEKGVGSTFWFALPLPPTNVASAAVRHIPPVSVGPRQILLVEDVPINQDLVRHILAASGHTVDVVGNGAEAIMAVQDMDYDIVLMDIQMPYLDGLTATRMIRNLPHRCSEVPIVAMTANVLPEQMENARGAGMNDVIHKPFSAAQIHKVLDGIVVGAPPGSRATPSADAKVLGKLVDLLGDAKVKTLLASLAASLACRFDDDPATPEGRAMLKRQAHASVAGSGMLGFQAFAASCKAFEVAAEDASFVTRLAGLRKEAAAVIAVASTLSSRLDPLADAA